MKVQVQFCQTVEVMAPSPSPPTLPLFPSPTPPPTPVRNRPSPSV